MRVLSAIKAGCHPESLVMIVVCKVTQGLMDMAYIFSDKIRVGISACNAGAHVRYNRAGWDRLEWLGRERDAFIWTLVCPEINAGLGTPRQPMKLVNGTGDDLWLGKARMKNRSGKDLSAVIKQGSLWALDILKLADIDAFIYMDGSPSCGVYRTTLKKQSRGKPPGVFGSLLLKEDWFLIPALDLDSPVKWWDWRRRLHAFIWLKHADITSKKTLYDIWHQFKFLCQEVDRNEADAIGSKLANMPKNLTRAFIEQWRQSVLRLIRRPSTPAKIRSVLQKHFAFYCKHYAKKTCDLSPKDIKLGSHALVEQIWKMEKKVILEGIEFTGTPVIYRATR